MIDLLLKVVVAYLLGSVSGSMVMGAFRHVDIRESGSGNAGGTNAFRTQGLRFALGVVAGSSVLGMLIPPSLLLIIFGVLAQISVGDLFLAAIVPGALLATVFGLGIYLFEVVVAILQAYIFTLLSAVYIESSLHPEH